MSCEGCKYNAPDWRLCTHPRSCTKEFWSDTSDYSCHEPGAAPEPLPVFNL